MEEKMKMKVLIYSNQFEFVIRTKLNRFNSI